MPLENNEGDSQLTGSTFNGEPTVVGGVYYGSGTVGNLPAYVQSIQTDVSGAQYITTSGSLPTVPAAGSVWPAGPTQVYTSGPQNVSGNVNLGNWPATLGVTASATLPVQGVVGGTALRIYDDGVTQVSGAVNIANWPATFGVTGSTALRVWDGGIQGVSASVQIPVYSTGPVSVSGTYSNASGTLGTSITSPNAAAAGIYAFVNPYGTLRVSAEAVALFLDSFDTGILDTTNRWTVTTTQGGSIAIVTGAVNFTNGTAPNAASILVSQPSFVQEGPGFVLFESTHQLAASPTLTTYHFWGQGQNTLGTGSVAVPLTDAVGFEQDINGHLNCVVYSSGSNIFSQQVTRPSDGAQHRYGYIFRQDYIAWYIDNQDVPVASVNFKVPNVSTLPIRIAVYNGSTAPASSPISNMGAVTVGDTTNSAVQISDGVYPWRQASINAQGALAVTQTPANTYPGLAYGTISTGAKTNVAIRASTYNEQSSNAQRSIASSNTNDASGGTGARTVTITYYDSSYNGPYTETVTLNGTTAVNTVGTNICFIEKITVSTVGSDGTNDGTLTLYVGTGGTGGTLAIVNASDGKTFWAHHYVANNRTCYITSMTGNNDNGSNYSLFTIRARTGAANSPDLQISDSITEGGAASQTERAFGTPLTVAGPARVVMWTAPNTTSTTVSRGSFDFYDQ